MEIPNQNAGVETALSLKFGPAKRVLLSWQQLLVRINLAASQASQYLAEDVGAPSGGGWSPVWRRDLEQLALFQIHHEVVTENELVIFCPRKEELCTLLYESHTASRYARLKRGGD